MLNRLRAKVSTLWSGLKRGWKRWWHNYFAAYATNRRLLDGDFSSVLLMRTRKARSRGERKWAIAGMALGAAPLLFGVLAKLLGLPATEHVRASTRLDPHGVVPARRGGLRRPLRVTPTALWCRPR